MSEKREKPHPDALPNYQNAVIPQHKITAYALSTTHKEGRHKARVFKSALGFDNSNWDLLSERILAELPFHEAALGVEDGHGKRYTVDLPILGPNGKIALVRTGWIIKTGTDNPSLSTTLVLPEKK